MDLINNKINLKAYGKINLFLDIVNLRNDGYHDLNMVMQSISLFDLIEIEIDTSCKFETFCFENGVLINDIPHDEKNIATKAAKKYFERINIQNLGCKINIDKNIPQMAGLAGGSADGAGVLIGLNYLFNNPLNITQLISLSKTIGADIPFCLIGGCAIVNGIGEKIEKIDLKYDDIYTVISKPNIGISTKQAFENFDNCLLSKKDYLIEKENNFKNFCSIIKNSSFESIAKNLYNDFINCNDNITIKQTIDFLKSFNKENGSAIMTGSGSACFSLFSDYNQAHECLKNISLQLNENFNALCKFKNIGVEILNN